MGISIVYAWGLKLAGIAVAGYIVYKYTFDPTAIVLFAFFAFLAIYFCFQLTRKRLWNREKALRDMALEEIVTIFLLPVILIPMIGLSEVFIILGLAIVYFIGMNSVLWKTRFAPRV